MHAPSRMRGSVLTFYSDSELHRQCTSNASPSSSDPVLYRSRFRQTFPKLEGRALSRLPLRGTVTTERDPPTRSASIF